MKENCANRKVLVENGEIMTCKEKKRKVDEKGRTEG